MLITLRVMNIFQSLKSPNKENHADVNHRFELCFCHRCLRRYAHLRNHRDMYSKIKIFLLSFSLIASMPSLADGVGTSKSRFQTYLANMRLCLSSSNVSECISSKIAKRIRKPADDYTRDEFVNLIISNPKMKEQLASCFTQSSKMIMSSKESKLFKSKKYACEASRVGDTWRLTAFYNFYSEE